MVKAACWLGVALVLWPLAAGHAAVRPAPSLGPLSARAEKARYHITYGAFGKLGEIELSFGSAAANGPVRAVGSGSGAVLGLGSTAKTIETTLDAGCSGTTGWTSTRVHDGKTVVDRVAQPAPGRLEMVRTRPDGTTHAATLSRAQGIVDPVALILRVRCAPPKTPQSFEVMDGRALWRVTVGPPRAETIQRGAATRALRFDLHAEPIGWDGALDAKRKPRAIVLHVTNDPARVPLQLSMPLGVGNVDIQLVALERSGPGGALTGHVAPGWLTFPGRMLRPVGRMIAAP